jgi:glycosyltransferase involved in cell wall biosynthesis
MHIAIAGTRGIPAAYGGFETFAQELAQLLVERGHQVTVFGRRKFGESREPTNLNGIEVRYSPTIFSKHLETPLAAITSLGSVGRLSVDVVLLCNAANSPFAWLCRLAGVPVAINVDGIERRRSKWGLAGRLWYRLGERCSVWFGDRVVADADVIASYYRERFGVSPVSIAYGARVVRREAGEVLARFGLKSREYILYVSRFEPENNALGVVQAYRQSGISIPLVMVGDAPYAKKYIESVHRAAGPTVIFTGYQFGEAYQELQSHAYAYIQATEVGGTHPALVEAMAYGNAIIANYTPEHVEVLGDAGWYYNRNDFNDLSRKFKQIAGDSIALFTLRESAARRAATHFSWENVTTQYEKLFGEMIEN